MDEGAPASLAKVFQDHGHEVVPFDSAVKRGSPDPIVCAAALANNAILCSFDKDMKQIARWGLGVSNERFKKLSLIQFRCEEAKSAKRLKTAMSFIEHEWAVSDAKAARRLFVEIGAHYLKSTR